MLMFKQLIMNIIHIYLVTFIVMYIRHMGTFICSLVAYLVQMQLNFSYVLAQEKPEVIDVSNERNILTTRLISERVNRTHNT